MYAQERLIMQLNEMAHELCQTDVGSKWLRVVDGRVPQIDPCEAREPVLHGFRAEGISLDELEAFRREDMDQLTTRWQKEWCETSNYGMAKYVKLLEKRVKKLAEVRREEAREATTTQADSISGIFIFLK